MIICEDHAGLLRGEDCPYCRIAELEAQLVGALMSITALEKQLDISARNGQELYKLREQTDLLQRRIAELEGWEETK